MRSRLFTIAFFLSVFGILVYAVDHATAESGGEPNHAEVGCNTGSTCHSPTPSTSTIVHVWTDASTIVAGQTYTFHISVAHPGMTGTAPGAGFDVHPSDGTLAKVTSNTKYWSFYNDVTQYGKKAFSNDSAAWDFKFTAPAAPGPVTIYAAGNAVNGDTKASSADMWDTTHITFDVVEQSRVSDKRSVSPYVNIYPNPTSGPLVISSHDVKDAVVHISDAAGHLLLNKHESLSNNSTLDLSNLANGAYFVTVIPKNGAPTVKRVTVQK